MKIELVDGFEIRVDINNGAAVISANKEGLLSLADQIAALAEELPGSHIHFDEHNSLEVGSAEMDKTADKLIASEKLNPLIIVCPDMDNSRGINSSHVYQEIRGRYGVVHKGRYKDYLINEGIPFIDNFFHTIRNRNVRYIGGVSSGGYSALSIGLRHKELFSKIGGHMPAIDLSYADEDECYFADEAMWLENDPISIARNASFNNMKVFLDDGKDDEGEFYYACEKLFRILEEKGVDVQNHLFEGHHNREYITGNMETYLCFYSGC